MTGGKIHADEVETDGSLVVRLIAAQFPQWAGLPVRPVPSGGTDNALYRLGDELAVRLPRIHWAVGQVEKEQQWLPRLAPHLPLAIPVPLAVGQPDEGYPWSWSVCRWLDGENAATERIRDLCEAATDLARFVVALQRIDTTGGPPPGQHNFLRGVPLSARDAEARAALSALSSLTDEVDSGAATEAWEAALRVPEWHDPPVWIHGDLQPGNLLAVRGRLSAVIDFGGLGIGDPACDLMVAWSLFSGKSRQVFRDALPVDDATWARGRGWALLIGLLALPYYLKTSPPMVRYARRLLTETLADYQRGA